MGRISLVEGLEPRRLFAAFAAPDPSFGVDGFKRMSPAQSSTLAAEATALPDGRIIYRKPFQIQFLRGDGTLDVNRGERGTLLVFQDHQVIVDPLTGRIATARQSWGDRVELRLYSPKGTPIAFSLLPANGETFREAAFSADGGLFWTGQRTTPDEPGSEARSESISVHKVRLQGDQLVVDESFGSNGVAQNIMSAHLAGAVDYFRTAAPVVDAQGRVSIAYDVVATNDDQSVRYYGGIERLTANGSPDNSDTGSRLVSESTIDSDGSGDTRQIYTRDRAYDAVTGAWWVLTYEYNRLEPGRTRLVLYRLDADGSRQNTTIGTETRVATTPPTGKVIVDPTGVARVIARGNLNGLTQVYSVRYTTDNGGQLNDTHVEDPFGNARLTPLRFDVRDVTIDRDGDLLLVGSAFDAKGSRTPALYSLRPTASADLSASSGASRLSGSGVLIVRGTDNSDRITVSRESDTIFVRINGNKPVSYKASAVRGLVIKGDKGNDFIDLAGTVGLGAYIEGGSGNDTLRGANDQGDTIFGNGGNDQIEGRGGADQIAGDAGKDTLLGGEGNDWLRGGAGEDALYASGLVRDPHGRDRVIDIMQGDEDKDFIRPDPNFGTLIDILISLSDAPDTIVY